MNAPEPRPVTGVGDALPDCLSCGMPLNAPTPLDCSVPDDHADPPIRDDWGPCRHGNGFPCQRCMRGAR